MRKENRVLASNGEINIRVTRSRAALLGFNGMNIPPKPPSMNQVQKYVSQGNTKRVALDESSTSGPHFQSKKRAVLKDVSNILSDISRKKCTHAVKMQTKNCTVSKPGGSKIDLKKSHTSCIEVKHVEIGANASEEVKKIKNVDVQDVLVSMELGELVPTEERMDDGPDKITQKCFNADQFPKERMSENSCTSAITSKVITDLCEEHGESKELSFNDIDCDQTNLRLCSLYAADIYHNLRVAERDITQNMRGILIDWLVEVSEEYKLVPDTLYLTVYVIDRFLSHNYIERQKLQLLGITSMLIASKYQEICAPGVEEFCFITDNTYTKGEVLKMESKVLTYLGFQLSFPTIKTFLRRYVRAAQASCKISSRTLECMANFLAELCLVEYSFLKFIPSLVAASAVFLAKWTLYQSDHPWNSTLQYYSLYKPSDLKEAVIKMRELQINRKGCPLNAVREKYKQEKFECVATLSSPELLESFF